MLTVLLDGTDGNGVLVSGPGHKGKGGESVQRILVLHVDLHHRGLGEPVVDQRQLVASALLVHVLVVHLGRYAAGQEHPLLQMLRPKDGLVDDVPRRGRAEGRPNKVVLPLPVDALQFAAVVDDGDPQVVGVVDGPVGVGVLLPHRPDVQLSALDGGPLPLHPLVGVTAALGDDEAGDDVGLLPVVGRQQLEDVAGPVVEGQEPVVVQRQFRQLHAPPGLVVLGQEGARLFELDGIPSGGVVPAQDARYQDGLEHWFLGIGHLGQFVEVGDGREAEGVIVDDGRRG